LFRSSLTDPRDPRWLDAPGHNDVVMQLLGDAYGFIQRGATQPEAYKDALAIAGHCARLRRSTHQNMLIFFALGMAYAGLSAMDRAAESYDEALNDAQVGSDWSAIAEISDQLGAALRQDGPTGRFEDAAGIYDDGLAALERLGDTAPPAHPSTLPLVFGRAVMLDALEQSATAREHYLIARALATQADDRLMRAGIDYMEANGQRSLGNPHAALPLMLAACDSLDRSATPWAKLVSGRAYAIAAEMALDVAEVFIGRGRLNQPSTYVDLSDSFARQALERARQNGDQGAMFLGQLALARCERVSGHVASSIHVLDPLLLEATRVNSPPDIIMVHTAMGQDHAARGEREPALAHFRLAARLADDTSGMGYLGAVARKALIRASVEA
jgi:tetratricopeptide (TPR) repeat protein